MNLLFILMIVILFHYLPFAEAADLNCAPLDPRQQIDERTSMDIQASAQTLFRIGKGEGSFKRETHNEVKNLYDKYPNADKIVLRDKLIYFLCTYFNSATDLDSEQKFQKFTTFISQLE